MTHTTAWEVDAFVHVHSRACDVPGAAIGRLRISIHEDGCWSVRIESETQTFSLILIGGRDSNTPALLNQTLSFLFGVAA